MFIGEYTHNIDQKGRLAIPVKFRKTLSAGAVVTRGIDKCLFIYSKEQWNVLAEKLTGLPLSQANSRAFARLMLAGAMDVELDGQGRILIPDYLRKYAGIAKKVIVAGLFNRLEVWDHEAWQIYKERTERESGDIAEKLGELGI
jgi:MraZ protein